MVTSATLVYTATITGPTTRTKLAAAMAAVPLEYDMLTSVGVTFTSDTTTTPSGTTVARTVVFALSPLFTAAFPAGPNQASPFVKLYLRTLELALGCPLVETAPLLA